ncbi:unnamed protein product [Blepharisma stoltei]|uniref:RRM domain-containing protein n=1 Tax=Blepharisma stoltei TaxID=1481888 RepID=A0AAU9IYD9_9CILI|nr:unnamed protein product [Blepharisma stoltei]
MEAKKANWADQSDEEQGSDTEVPAAPKAHPAPKEPRPRQDLSAYIQSKEPPFYFKLINIPFSCDKASDIQGFFGLTDEDLSSKKASIKMIHFEEKFKGVAYVNAWDAEIAKKIVEKNETELKGRKIGILVETKGPSEGRGNRGKDRKPREGFRREEGKDVDKEQRRGGYRGKKPYAPRGKGQFRQQEEEKKEEKKEENIDDVWGESAEITEPAKEVEIKKAEEPKVVKERVVKPRAWGDPTEAASILAKPSQAQPPEVKKHAPYEHRGDEKPRGRGKFRGRRPNKD